MSSKVSYYLYFLFSMAVALFFVLLGVLAVLLPIFPGIRVGLNVLIIENSIAIFLVGLTLVIIGCTSIAAIIYGSKRQSYSIKVTPHQTTIDDTLFQGYLIAYCRKIFPKYDIPCSVKIRNNRVHITAELPYIPREKQKGIVEQMQNDITDLFTRYLGYKAEYRFSVNFLENP